MSIVADTTSTSLSENWGTLGDDAPVDGDHGASVVIQTIAVAALLVCIQVDTAELDARVGPT